ncbi:hypothetical protein U0070_000769, partial [Myodes glareolus]
KSTVHFLSKLYHIVIETNFSVAKQTDPYPNHHHSKHLTILQKVHGWKRVHTMLDVKKAVNVLNNPWFKRQWIHTELSLLTDCRKDS